MLPITRNDDGKIVEVRFDEVPVSVKLNFMWFIFTTLFYSDPRVRMSRWLRIWLILAFAESFFVKGGRAIFNYGNSTKAK